MTERTAKALWQCHSTINVTDIPRRLGINPQASLRAAILQRAVLEPAARHAREFTLAAGGAEVQAAMDIFSHLRRGHRATTLWTEQRASGRDQRSRRELDEQGAAC